MSETLSERIKYNALLRKDKSFEGLFFVAVKTTGIFCRPSCTARKPKRENVVFYETSLDAMRDGFRPCKVCRPLAPLGEAPEEITGLLKQIELNPFEKIRDYDLTQKGLQPSRVRRWFIANHGMTFQAYQRLMRINSAYTNISNGSKVTDAAFDNGYSSLSGFQHTFKKAAAMNPKDAGSKEPLALARLETPLGQMIAVASSKGICILEFTDRRMLETQFRQVEKHFQSPILPGKNKHFEILKIQLAEYFNGNRKEFEVPLHTVGTPFQKSVWDILRKIPYGETISYKKEAEMLGKPTAVRAVANANGHNRIAVIIPCHRVIGDNGKLVGYGGGLWRKDRLLKLEKSNC